MPLSVALEVVVLGDVPVSVALEVEDLGDVGDSISVQLPLLQFNTQFSTRCTSHW